MMIFFNSYNVKLDIMLFYLNCVYIAPYLIDKVEQHILMI